MIKSIKNIYDKLLNYYSIPKTSLYFNNEVEAWAAILLSVQCTDIQVNKVTHVLFNKYKTFNEYSNANIKILEDIIKSTGFYNKKAGFLKNGAIMIINEFNNILPDKMNDLIKLPGVGRKVANVILSEVYHSNQGVAIDTHNIRIFNRIGFLQTKNPLKIEKYIKKRLSKNKWNIYSQLMVEHGRKICIAKKPKCNICFLKPFCNYGLSKAF